MAERTKIWIADAMKRLLVKKPLEKIFVTDICKEAEIERPTFYYHFNDKYDLMAWIFCQRTLQTDVLSVESATTAMNGMRQDYIISLKWIKFIISSWSFSSNLSNERANIVVG